MVLINTLTKYNMVLLCSFFFLVMLFFYYAIYQGTMLLHDIDIITAPFYRYSAFCKGIQEYFY